MISEIENTILKDYFLNWKIMMILKICLIRRQCLVDKRIIKKKLSSTY